MSVPSCDKCSQAADISRFDRDGALEPGRAALYWLISRTKVLNVMVESLFAVGLFAAFYLIPQLLVRVSVEAPCHTIALTSCPIGFVFKRWLARCAMSS